MSPSSSVYRPSLNSEGTYLALPLGGRVGPCSCRALDAPYMATFSGTSMSLPNVLPKSSIASGVRHNSSETSSNRSASVLDARSVRNSSISSYHPLAVAIVSSVTAPALALRLGFLSPFSGSLPTKIFFAIAVWALLNATRKFSGTGLGTATIWAAASRSEISPWYAVAAGSTSARSAAWGSAAAASFWTWCMMPSNASRESWRFPCWIAAFNFTRSGSSGRMFGSSLRIRFESLLKASSLFLWDNSDLSVMSMVDNMLPK